MLWPMFILRANSSIGVFAATAALALARHHIRRRKLSAFYLKRLQKAVEAPVVPLPFLFDERLTTVAAERMMQDLGMKPDQRKARIDEVAASIILQDFLDSKRDRGAM